jgi:exodeoxyribonuclease VII large subunit
MVDGVAQESGELRTSRHDDALSIADLYDEVEGALQRAFPRRRELWVRGEIQHLSDQRAGRGHCYLDLVDPESSGERQAPVLRVKCWQSTWGPLRAALRREGIELQPGMVVVLRGSVDFYRPKAEIGFVLAELDVTALLGRMAAQRAALLRALEAEGLLVRNRSLEVPPVPLRVGLVASPGTEGYRDFLGQLTMSGFGFRVSVVPAVVQGPGAPAALCSAVRRLAAAGPARLDVMVIVRGGGSKADLAAFDAASVARAVASSPLPVWTGIGHTGDESVTDVVANRACITPTECARELVARVQRWWDESVAGPASVVGRCAVVATSTSQREHDAVRTRLCAMARHLVARQSEHVARRSAGIAACAPRLADDAGLRLRSRGVRISPLAHGLVERSEDRVGAWRRLLNAYDVERQLERGYTLTLDADGRILRSVADVARGGEIVTRFADGNARSLVEEVVAGSDDGVGPREGTRAEAYPDDRVEV